MENFKIDRIRDDKYLVEIRKLPCILKQDGEHCNGAPVVPHHLTALKDGVMGDKAGDDKVVPLCTLHHNALHFIGELKFWKTWKIKAEKEAKQLWEDYQLFIKGE